LLGRSEELHIYGPAQLREIIEIQLKASQTQLVYPIEYHVTNPDKPETVFETDEHFVKSFPLDHRIATTGFVFGEKLKPRKVKKSFLFFDEEITVEDILSIKAGGDFTSKSGKVYKNEEITDDPPVPGIFGYCSDTRYHEPVIEMVQGADLLYHEATFMEKMKGVAREKYHSTALEAATIAKKAGVKKLLLGHFSARYRELDELLQEARNIFPETELAFDGVTHEIR
jgi:ribonuclease Z